MYCTAVSSKGLSYDPYEFKVAYDKLIIAVGAEPMTFNIKGVKEHATFLREVYHAQKIRQKLLLNLMLSEHPGKYTLLSFLVKIYREAGFEIHSNKLSQLAVNMFDGKNKFLFPNFPQRCPLLINRTNLNINCVS